MINYSLTVQNVKNQGKFDSLFSTIKEFDLYRYVFDEGTYFEKEKEAVFKSWEAQGWERHKGTMIIISEKYPEMIFELTCHDEDNFWRLYLKDGATEFCLGEVIFERPRKFAWSENFK